MRRTQQQFLHVMSFVAALVVVYWLALRWLFERWRGKAPRSRFEQGFRSNWTGGFLLGLAGLGVLCMVYGIFIEPQRLTVKTYTVETSKLPPGQRVRLVQLADLHVREAGPRERKLPDLVRELKPDIILHTGDFFGTRDNVSSIVAPLLRSWAVPQFAVEGNLDGLGDFDGCMRHAGITVLDGNTPQFCEVRGLRLCISGFPSGMEGAMRSALQRLPRDTFNIVLYHHPQGFPATWETPTDLMLAGHTHGGQIRLPFYGALITLDRFGKRWEYGAFDEHGLKLIVSRGIGCEPLVPEMRFHCAPEVVVIDVVGAHQPEIGKP